MEKLTKVPDCLWNGEQVYLRHGGRQVVVRSGVMVVVPTNPERDEQARIASLRIRAERKAREERKRLKLSRSANGGVAIPKVDPFQEALAIFRAANPGLFNRAAAEAAPKTEPGHKTNIGAGTAKGPGGSKQKATTNPKKAEKHRRRFEQRGKRMKKNKKKKH